MCELYNETSCWTGYNSTGVLVYAYKPASYNVKFEIHTFILSFWFNGEIYFQKAKDKLRFYQQIILYES